MDLALVYSGDPLDYDLSVCQIQGTYLSDDLNPMTGNVTFTPSPNELLNANRNTIIYPTSTSAVLDENGSISIQVIASDDVDLNPNGWTYTVVESLSYNGANYSNTYSIEAPSNAIINLADVIPVPSYTGTPIVRGRPGANANVVTICAQNPDLIAVGAITRSATNAATSFNVVWPDTGTGTFTGTESTSFPGAIDSYAVTHVLGGLTNTYTQPTLTRNAAGVVTNRPAIVVT